MQKNLNNPNNVNFFQKDVIHMALKKNIEDEVQYKYDLIYSTGLFDYFDEKVATRLLANLKKLIKRDGKIVVANFGEKYNNSSAGLMEWVTDWYLVYRSEEEFSKIFLEAGFLHKNLKLIPQDSNKIILYCLADNN